MTPFDLVNLETAIRGAVNTVQMDADRLKELIVLGDNEAAYALATSLQGRLFEINYDLRKVMQAKECIGARV